MADDLQITQNLVIPGRDLTWAAVRASGPGGQNVNKVSSKVELRFDLAGTTALSAPVKARLHQMASNRLDAEGKILIVSQLTRDQERNLEDARNKLAALIRSALEPPKPRHPTKPTFGSKLRRLHSKAVQSNKKKSRGAVRDSD